MPPILDHSPTGLPSIIARLAAHVAAGLWRSAIDRRVLRRLSHMSDRELAAGGLARADVIEASRPETADAIALLRDRRDRRRALRRS